MAMRPAVGIVNQYAVESTRGTGVTAAKKLVASSFMMSKQYTNAFYRIPGSIFSTTGVRHRSWSAGNLEGLLSYEEAHLQAAMMFCAPVITDPTTGAYTYTYTFSSTPADTWKAITGQAGDSVAAREVNGLALVSYAINFGNDGISVSGDCIGKSVDTGATLDTLTTTLAEQPVSMADVHCYIDTTSGGLGTTEWCRSLKLPFLSPPISPPRSFRVTQQSKSLWRRRWKARSLPSDALTHLRPAPLKMRWTPTRSLFAISASMLTAM